jgi:hypothetical protein
MVETSTQAVTEPTAPAADADLTDALANGEDVRSLIPHQTSVLRTADATTMQRIRIHWGAHITCPRQFPAGLCWHVQGADQEGKGPG